MPDHGDVYKIGVIGGGPSGVMAAIRAGSILKGRGRNSVVLLERNDAVCKKLVLTGRGRCNITNAAGLETFIEKFGKQGQFFRDAFKAFSNKDLIDFFKSKGLDFKVERQGRVFPSTDSAVSVKERLVSSLREENIHIKYNTTVTSIRKDGGAFIIELESGEKIKAEKAIVASGGVSFKATGSRGDGFRIAKGLGHKVSPPLPCLVPLKIKEKWVKDLQGLSLKNVRLTFSADSPVKGGKKNIRSEIGECAFTHFGISGPLVLDSSLEVTRFLEKHGIIKLFIDLKPGLSEEDLNSRLLREFASNGAAQLNSIMKGLVPKRLVGVALANAGLDPVKKGSQVTSIEREALVRILKRFGLTVTGTLPVEEAMVTAGGVSLKEINPKTMESRIIPGLYFAGELIEGAAPSGGYNLQEAFSTGYLAGQSAAYA